MTIRRVAVAWLLHPLLASCGSDREPPVSPPSGSSGWAQWGQNAQHSGRVDVAAQSPDRVLAEVVYDPFAPQEQAAARGSLLVHYPAPLVGGDDVFLMSKGGTFSGLGSWSTQTWLQTRLHWEGGRLVEKWTFPTDWKPEPDAGALRGWEPVHQAALGRDHLYAPGLGGTVLKLGRPDGALAARINPFGGGIDDSIFVSGPLTIDGAGNVFYNALRLDLADPWGSDVRDAWLVRIAADGSAAAVRFATLTAGAPRADDACPLTFSASQLPWPPSSQAAPPSGPCGSQRPGLNVAPAIAPDGTIYTVSRAHFNGRWGYLVAVNPDLSPRWMASLRERLTDGCGVAAAAGGTLPPNGAPGGCRSGANLGVDPATNRPGDGEVVDRSSSSPTVAPDGGILYGAYTRYNYARGHLMKFSPAGQFLAAHGFGWDTTPAVYARDGAYSVLIKDNHYEGVGSYCNDDAVCPRDQVEGPYSIVQLRGDTLAAEWAYASTNTSGGHANGFEWCINAPAVDRDGVVYANSEDGSLYAIGQGGTLRKRLFLSQALGAAYTPLAIGPDGLVYTQNAGHLFVVGR